MEEIKQIHDINVEWGCITNLLDKISDIESSIEGGWPELIDMVADAVMEESEKKDAVSAFFNLYMFLFRLYYRLKTNPNIQKFNQYSKNGDEYWIVNYDYTIFTWANKNGYTQEIDNLVVKIPRVKLNDKQRRALDRRCAKEKKYGN